MQVGIEHAMKSGIRVDMQTDFIADYTHTIISCHSLISLSMVRGGVSGFDNPARHMTLALALGFFKLKTAIFNAVATR